MGLGYTNYQSPISYTKTTTHGQPSCNLRPTKWVEQVVRVFQFSQCKDCGRTLFTLQNAESIFFNPRLLELKKLVEKNNTSDDIVPIGTFLYMVELPLIYYYNPLPCPAQITIKNMCKVIYNQNILNYGRSYGLCLEAIDCFLEKIKFLTNDIEIGLPSGTVPFNIGTFTSSSCRLYKGERDDKYILPLLIFCSLIHFSWTKMDDIAISATIEQLDLPLRKDITDVFDEILSLIKEITKTTANKNKDISQYIKNIYKLVDQGYRSALGGESSVVGFQGLFAMYLSVINMLLSCKIFEFNLTDSMDYTIATDLSKTRLSEINDGGKCLIVHSELNIITIDISQ